MNLPTRCPTDGSPLVDSLSLLGVARCPKCGGWYHIWRGRLYWDDRFGQRSVICQDEEETS